MKRSKHTLSHYRLLTGKMGQLLPIGLTEVLPGDTFQMHSDVVMRLAPMNAPVMHPTQVRIHHWFVPNRLVWDGWEKFITGGPDGADNQLPPQVMTSSDKTGVMHRLGTPIGSNGPINVSALPLRAYNAIFNEWYRDQDIVAERTEDDDTIANVAWEKDYFTTCRPWTQKGPEVTIPLGGTAPVQRITSTSQPTWQTVGFGSQPFTKKASNDGDNPDMIQLKNTDTNIDAPVKWGTSTGLEADLSSASAINVNDLRTSFAIQRYQEARARYGSRYVEYLRYLGVKPSDARLQRPELLGASTGRVQFSEVLQTTPASQQGEPGVADMYGHGIAGLRGNKFRRFFEEHGYVLSLLSVRPKSIYQNSIDRHWLKTEKESFYQRELEQIGQQQVLQRELVGDTNVDPATVFGYQDRYREYREGTSRVQGDFIDDLNFWHMARVHQGNTALNEQFMKCNPSDRIFQVQNRDPLWIMVNNHIVARRLVRKNANARVL